MKSIQTVVPVPMVFRQIHDAEPEDGAFVDAFGTIATEESWRARTCAAVADAVNARTAIGAGIGRSAIVDFLHAKVSVNPV